MSAFCALHPDGTLACSCGYVAREVETEYGRCDKWSQDRMSGEWSVSYPPLRAHETPEQLLCRLLLEEKKKQEA